MSVIKTHTGIVITRDGEKRMKLHSTETSWVAGRCESYDKKTGYRWGGHLTCVAVCYWTASGQ